MQFLTATSASTTPPETTSTTSTSTTGCTFCAGGIPPENQGINTSIEGTPVECGVVSNSGLCSTSTGCSPDCADGTGTAAQTCCPVVTTTTSTSEFEYAL